MARIRTIKPEFWTDEDLSELPPETHMLAAALLNYADDEGYFNANPKLVKATCCPLREDSTNVRRGLELLAGVGYIRLGKSEDGKEYGCIPNFSKHQRVDRPTLSKIKEIDIDWGCSSNPRRILDESSLLEGKGKERKGIDSAEQQADSAPAVAAIPLNDGSEHPITQTNVDEWSALYPAVDVLQELRNMRGWAISNPKKRKTRSGVMKFINSWLAREQDKGGAAPPAPKRTPGYDPDTGYMGVIL